jgi:hypothetical protein
MQEAFFRKSKATKFEFNVKYGLYWTDKDTGIVIPVLFLTEHHSMKAY